MVDVKVGCWVRFGGAHQLRSVRTFRWYGAIVRYYNPTAASAFIVLREGRRDILEVVLGSFDVWLRHA